MELILKAMRDGEPEIEIQGCSGKVGFDPLTQRTVCVLFDGKKTYVGYDAAFSRAGEVRAIEAAERNYRKQFATA